MEVVLHSTRESLVYDLARRLARSLNETDHVLFVDMSTPSRRGAMATWPVMDRAGFNKTSAVYAVNWNSPITFWPPSPRRMVLIADEASPLMENARDEFEYVITVDQELLDANGEMIAPSELDGFVGRLMEWRAHVEREAQTAAVSLEKCQELDVTELAERLDRFKLKPRETVTVDEALGRNDALL